MGVFELPEAELRVGLGSVGDARAVKPGASQSDYGEVDEVACWGSVLGATDAIPQVSRSTVGRDPEEDDAGHIMAAGMSDADPSKQYCDRECEPDLERRAEIGADSERDTRVDEQFEPNRWLELDHRPVGQRRQGSRFRSLIEREGTCHCGSDSDDMPGSQSFGLAHDRALISRGRTPDSIKM